MLPSKTPAALALALAAALLAGCSALGHDGPAPTNALTARERSEGWRLLFDGASTAGWRGYKAERCAAAWGVEDGCLRTTGGGGDVMTSDEFGDFELRLEWRIGAGGNSGIVYHVVEADGADYVWQTGPEVQILDDAAHPGADPTTTAGSCYALYAPAVAAARPVGEFNEARLRVEDGHVTHWLNGERICDYDLGSEDWDRRVAASKFGSMPHFARARRGHLALQDHGDPVWFRSIAIREL